MSPEARVGAVTLLALVAAIGFALALPGTGLLRPQGYPVTVSFKDAGGIAPGAPVRMSGVQVGQIQAVGLSSTGEALITLMIRPGVEIPQGSRFRLATAGIVGDQFVAVDPGRPGPAIAPGAVVRGSEGFSLERTAARLEAAADQVAVFVRNADALLGDPQMRRDLREAIRNAREATEIARGVLVETRGAVASVRRTATAVEAVAGSVRKVTETDIVAVAQDLRTMSGNLVETSERLQAFVEDTAGDGALSADIRQTASSLRDAGERIRRMAQDLQGVINPENVAKTRDVVDDARAAVKDARAVVDQAGSVVRQTGSILQRVDRLVPERLPGRSGMVALTYELWHNGSRAGHGVDATLLPGAGRSYRMGMLDIGHGGAILQVGTRLTSTVWWRAGIYDSQPSLGLDYRPGALSFALDLYNLNEVTADARLRYQISPRWGVMVGGRNLLRTPALVFGLGTSF
jgi:phospholipid/cholesterol/gamma-HCH transport system substrate-binding protein